MQRQIEGFPMFNNPFAGQSASILVTPAPMWSGAGLNASYSPLNVTGTANRCTTVAWWNCVFDPNGPDGNGSAVSIGGPSHWILGVNMSSAPNSGLVQSGYAEIWCRSWGTSASPITVGMGQETGPGAISAQLVSQGYNSVCPTGNYSRVIVNLVPAGGTVLSDLSVNPQPNFFFSVNPVNPNTGAGNSGTTSIQITYIRATVVVTGASASCGGSSFFSNIGCSIGAALTFLGNLALFVINGIIFIGQVLFWFVSLVGIFFGSLFSVLNIPGIPPFFSGIIGFLIIGVFLYVAIVVMSKIRGSGSTA